MQEVLVSKIFNYTSAPTKNVEGQFWFNPSTNVLSRFNGTIWKPITVSSDDVAVLTDGSKVSLTNYLNTQIAVLAEGIDSKQDSLHTYTETESTGAHGSKSWSNVKILAEGGENTSGSIKLEAGPGGGGQSTITLTAGYGVIALDSGTGGEIKLEGNLTGSALSTSIPDSAANTSNAKVPTTEAVKTELDKKQGKLSNPGFLYLNNGYAISECKPTFSSAQSLVFTYEVTEEELTDATWFILGNIRVWDRKKGLAIAKGTSSSGQRFVCGFNWGYGQNGDTTSRSIIDIPTLKVVDGKPHTYALICGKTDTDGYFKVYQDGLLINSKTISLFDDFTPKYGFSLGKHQTSGATDNPARGRMSNVAFFNFDISDSTKTYTINDYHNGKSIPQSLITATEGERAIWVLDNYTRTNSLSKKYIKDLAGNNDAIITNDIHDIIDGKVDDILDSNNTLYQTKEDNSLLTTDKTITGSINELKTSVDNKQNSLQYYSEDTIKSVSKLSSNRLEVNCYDESGTTYNPFILGNENGIAIGGSESYGGKGVLTNIGKGYMNLETPGGTTVINYDSLKIEGTGESTFKVLTHPWDSDFTSSKINVSAINSSTYDVLLSLKDDKVNISSATVGSITPSAFTSTNAQTLICADAFAIKPTTKTLFGFNNSAYNISTNRYAGLFYLKNTDANSTGISINPDNIILSDYNNYSSSDEGTYFAATEIDKGRISLQKRTNGSSEFIDSGYINPDSIKLHNGKYGSTYDRTSDIIITASRDSSDAPNFHGIAYKCSDSTDAQWFIGRTVDGDNPVEGQPTVSKPYIKGFANAEFSEKVQATTIQAGKEVSSSSGIATLTEKGINFNTPAGTATYAFNGIDISNAFFKVVGGSDTYVQIPDNNGSNFKIWKGTETQFKTLTSVNSDTVYLRVQENNRIKATVGTDTASLENITDSYTLSSTSLTSFITDTKYNNAQGSILITPSLTNSGALIFGENITDTSKGFPLYPDNIVSIPFKNITNFKVAGSINDSFNYIVSFDI